MKSCVFEDDKVATQVPHFSKRDWKEKTELNSSSINLIYAAETRQLEYCDRTHFTLDPDSLGPNNEAKMHMLQGRAQHDWREIASFPLS